MPQIVKVGQVEHEFPDDMDDAQISAVLDKEYAKPAAPAEPAGPSLMQRFKDVARRGYEVNERLPGNTWESIKANAGEMAGGVQQQYEERQAEQSARDARIAKQFEARKTPFERNQPYAKASRSYLTTLAPQEEAGFQAWVKKNNVPFDPSADADYDMRGFYKGLMSGDEHAQTGVNSNDGKLHFSDYWKTPYHKSFSAESKWAKEGAPKWNDQDQLVLADGTVVFDERNAASPPGSQLATKLQDEAFQHDIKAGRGSRQAGEAAIAGEDAVPKDAGFVERAMQSGLSSGATSLPAVALGGPVGGSILLGVGTGGQRYAELTRRGVSRETAASSGAMLGGLEALTEFIPGEVLVKNVPGFWKHLGEFMLTEIPGENISSIAQLLDDYRLQMRDDVTMNDVMSTIYDTTAATAVGSGAQIGAAKLIESTMKRLAGQPVTPTNFQMPEPIIKAGVPQLAYRPEVDAPDFVAGPQGVGRPGEALKALPNREEPLTGVLQVDSQGQARPLTQPEANAAEVARGERESLGTDNITRVPLEAAARRTATPEQTSELQKAGLAGPNGSLLPAGRRALKEKRIEEVKAKASLAPPNAPIETRKTQDGYTVHVDGAPAATTETEAAANELVRHAQNERPAMVLGQQVDHPAQPTEGQAEAGNYRKPAVRWNDMTIRIENVKGSERSGKDSQGKQWSRKLTSDYGYVSRTQAKDGDAVDVYMGGTPDSEMVYVIDQLTPDGQAYDEMKAVVAAPSQKAAEELYLSNYPKGWKGLGAITPLPVAKFRDLVMNGDATKPIAWKPTAAKEPPRQDSSEKAANRVVMPEPTLEVAHPATNISRDKTPIKTREELPAKKPSLVERMKKAVALAAKVDPVFERHGERLKAIANEAGWSEIGGKMIRASEDVNSPDYSRVTGRTKWLARNDLWQQAQQAAPLTGNKEGMATRGAVRKALAGEKLSAAETRHVRQLVEGITHEQMEADRLAEMEDGEAESALAARIGELEERLKQAQDEMHIEGSTRIQVVGDEVPFMRRFAPAANIPLFSRKGGGSGDLFTGKVPEPPADQRRLNSQQVDLFGDPVAIKNEIARLKAELAKRQERRHVPLETGNRFDLFSHARQQEEIPTPAQPEQAPNGEPDVQRTIRPIEPNRARAADADDVGTEPVPAERGGQAGGTGEAVPAAQGERTDAPGSERVPAVRPAAGGKQSDLTFHSQSGLFGDEVVAPRGDVGRGSIEDRGGGQPDDELRADEASDAAADARPGVSREQKRALQRAAEPIEVINADPENIAATLPFLLPTQHEDVHTAERRFREPNGYGMLFTNGTGTGKTFVGLGIIKRLVKRGKGRILIAVPSQKIADDWILAGAELGLDLYKLDSLQDKGRGVSITTHANMGENQTLADDEWDHVLIDEAHGLMQGAQANPTAMLYTLRVLTYHPESARDRAAMLNRTLYNELESAAERIKKAGKWAPMELRDRRDHLAAQFELKVNEQRAIVAAKKGFDRPRATFLTATPFAYEKNVQWGEGYLFEYDRSKDEGRGYNDPDSYAYFMITHFGYRMRVGKLTEPDANVDRDLMQRNFNTWLRKEGALSARMLEVDKDYDRKFVYVESKIGAIIDEGLEWLRAPENRRFWPLYDVIRKRFDFLERSRLLQALKAREAIPYIKKQHALGRKVVVFYDYNEGGSFNVFEIDPESFGDSTVLSEGSASVKLKDLAREFIAARPDLVSLETAAFNPLITLGDAFPQMRQYNGNISTKNRNKFVREFNDDEMPDSNLIMAQKAANAGWSAHDTTGIHQRVLINLGLPTAPVTAIQQEGRIYRVGQESDAIFRYFNTGTSWERWAFASTIAHRAGTAENLAMGEQARGLKDAFITAFEAADIEEPAPGDGKGGKVADRAIVNALSDFDKAKGLYWAQQKKTSRTKAAEGTDYFATPEPLGQKMVEWLDLRHGEKTLEPSAGHGAIARWLPENSPRTLVEPSQELASRLALVTDGKILVQKFESLSKVNKFHGIVMNPPFGTAGRTAIDHIEHASELLYDGGRLIALIPDGPSAGAKFDKWYEGQEEMHLVREISLPTVTFERAGTTVKSRIVIMDRMTKKAVKEGARIEGMHSSLDISDVEDIKEFFARIENIGAPDRVVIRDTEAEAAAAERAAEQQREDEIAKRIEERRAATNSKMVSHADLPKAGETVVTGGAYKIAQFPHSKTGAQMYVATPKEYLGDGYAAVLSKAKAQGGWYSSFKQGGAISGFLFKTAQARENFLRSVNAEPPKMLRTKTPVTGLLEREVRNQINETLRSFQNRPYLSVVQDYDDLPAARRQRLEDRGGKRGDMTAFFDEGTIYFIANEFNSPEAVTEALLHEYVVHYGLSALPEETRAEILDGIARDNPEAVERFGYQEFGDQWNRENDFQRRFAAEEALAYTGQRYLQGETIGDRMKRWVDYFIAAIRDLVRYVGGLGPKFDKVFIKRLLQDLQTHLKSGDARGFLDRNTEGVFADPDQPYMERTESTVDDEPMFQRSPQAMNRLRPQFQQNGYKAMADKAVNAWNDAIGWRWSPLGKLPQENAYLKLRYATLGKLDEVKGITRGIFDSLKVATPADAQAVYDYLTTFGANSAGIVDNKIRIKAEEVKLLIDDQGQALVTAGLLPQESYDEYAGQYLPRLYLKHILGDDVYRAMGSGMKTTDQGYLKKRKDIPEEMRKVILGQIYDPAFLASFGVSRTMRDLAMIDFMEEVSQNAAWVPQKMLVQWNNRKVSPYWLQKEAARVRKQADFLKDSAVAVRARTVADGMDTLANTALSALQGADLSDFKQMPDTPRYGALRGMWVRKEIYEDMVAATQFIDPRSFEAFFQRTSGKLTRYWKTAKVGVNVPSHLRNMMGNAIQLQLSGVPFHKMPMLFAHAINSIRTDDRYYQIAKRYGLRQATFANTELARIRDEFILLAESKSADINKLQAVFSKMTQGIGDLYQAEESLFKLAKLRYEMDENGLGEADAMLEAHKWLFDYSLVPRWIRYLRNAPLGSPFACVDDQTQALTKDGWKGIDELAEGDQIASYDMNGGELQWKNVNWIYRNQYDGPMLAVKDRHLDMMLTPDHRCVTLRKRRVKGMRKYNLKRRAAEIVLSQDLNRADAIPVAAPFSGLPEIPVMSDDFVRVLAWVAAEGHFQKSSKQVGIAQNAEKSEPIRAALRGAGMTWGEQIAPKKQRAGAFRRNDDIIAFYVHAAHGRRIRAELPGKQLTPALLHKLTAEQIDILIETFIDGDGSRNGDRSSIIQKPGQTAEAIKMALTMAGRSYGVHIRKDGVEHIGLRDGKSYTLQRTKKQWVDYSGRIWCPQVDSLTTWVARRSGKVFITGNTYTYKAMPRLAETLIRKPWKFLPYIAMHYALKAVIMAAWDVPDDELEKLKAAFPSWMRMSGGMMLMPVKDQHGRWQALNVGYIMPWGSLFDSFAQIGEGEFAKSVSTMTGVMGGPIPDMISAWQTGKDAFTGKDIVNKALPVGQQNMQRLNYVLDMALPGWLSPSGWAGKMKDLLRGNRNVDPRTGEPKLTAGQTMGRLFGFTIYPVDAEETRKTNVYFMQRAIEDIGREGKKVSRDKSLSDEEKTEQRRVIRDYMKEQTEELNQYKRESRYDQKLDEDIGPAETTKRVFKKMRDLLQGVKDKPDAAARVREAGYPAFAGLLEDLPAKPRPAVKKALQESVA